MEKKQNSAPNAPKRSTRPRVSYDDRKEEIYRKAAAAFAQKGYLNTNMNQLAEAAHLKKGGLYHYIKNKETLLFEILDRTLDVFLEQAVSLPLEGLSPEEKFKRLLRNYTKTLVRYHNEITLLVLAGTSLKPKFRNIVHHKRIQYEQFFYSVISEGFSRKVFVEHDDKETLGFMIFGSIFNYYLWKPAELKGDVENKLNGFTNFFLNGLLAR